jgi:hypothetical protein
MSAPQRAAVGPVTASNSWRAAREVEGSERRAWSGRVLRRRASPGGGWVWRRTGSISGGGRGSKVGSDGWSTARFLDASARFGGKKCRGAKSAAHGPDASGVAVASGSVAGVQVQPLLPPLAFGGKACAEGKGVRQAKIAVFCRWGLNGYTSFFS